MRGLAGIKFSGSELEAFGAVQSKTNLDSVETAEVVDRTEADFF